MHFFESWKVAKYRKQRKNKLLQRLLDEIESQAVSEILEEVNAEEQELILSSDDEEEEAARVPLPGLDGAQVLETCVVCRKGDDGEQMTWVSFKCGHQFCETCADRLLALQSVCPQARCELKDKRRLYHNVQYVVKSTQSQKQVPRVLSQDERRQENVLMMRGRAHSQPPETVDLASSDDKGLIDSGNKFL